MRLMTALCLCAPVSTKVHYFSAAQLSKQVLGCCTMHTLESFGWLHGLSREAEGILTWVPSESSDSSVLFVTKVSHSHKILDSAENDQSCDSASKDWKINVKIQSKRTMFSSWTKFQSITWLKFQHECIGMSCMFSDSGSVSTLGIWLWGLGSLQEPCQLHVPRTKKNRFLLETWKFCQTKSALRLMRSPEVKAFNKRYEGCKTKMKKISECSAPPVQGPKRIQQRMLLEGQ